MLADTATDIVNVPWDKLSFVSACVIVIVILWRLVGKLAGDKDGQNEKLVAFYRERADESAAMAQKFAEVVNNCTLALQGMTKQLELNNEILKDLAHEFEKRGD